jgi:D-3-phosphoglycerate dehydrogenase
VGDGATAGLETVMRIAVLDDTLRVVRRMPGFERLHGHDVIVLHEHMTEAHALAARIGAAEALLLNRERTVVTRVLLDLLPTLKIISQTGQAIPHIDVGACTERGILVCAAGRAPLATVELTWALILASRRRIVLEAQAMRGGRWQTGLGTTVRNRTLGIFGYGTIGHAVAAIAPAFGMQVLVWGREGSLARARDEGVAVASSQEDLFARSDVLTLHLHLNEGSRGVVRREHLDLMHPWSLLVNTSRSALIEPGALVAALSAGRPGHAAVVVFDEEPIDRGHPLLHVDNVLCTPHIGHVESDAYEHFYGIAIEQIVGFAAGAPINVVNREAFGIVGL